MLGQEPQQAGRLHLGGQQAALLGLPEDGDRVAGCTSPDQCGQALPESCVQGLGEVGGVQPSHLLGLVRLCRRGGEQHPLLGGRLSGVGYVGPCGGGGAGHGSRMRWKARCEAVHHFGQSVGRGEGGGDGVLEGDVPRGLREPLGAGTQETAGVLGLDHPRVRTSVPGRRADLDQSV
ncbi:hypothetical protein QFZ74_000036 [Streptomyces sp. V3I7]|nr:hypothetical protein [Streptomyces sp. V3I7]